MNNTCVKHNFKSVHVSNLFWSREYNSAKEICKYPSYSKVGGNYPWTWKLSGALFMFKCFVVCKLKKCPQKSTVSTGLMAEHMPLNFNKLMICMPLKPVQGKPLF